MASHLAEIVRQSDSEVDDAAWDDGFAAGFREGGAATMRYIMGWGEFAEGRNDIAAPAGDPPDADDYIGNYITRWGRT